MMLCKCNDVSLALASRGTWLSLRHLVLSTLSSRDPRYPRISAAIAYVSLQASAVDMLMLYRGLWRFTMSHLFPVIIPVVYISPQGDVLDQNGNVQGCRDCERARELL